MKKQKRIVVCVACSHINAKSGNGFPLFCPLFNMPCMAIAPDYVLNKQDELIKIALRNHYRVPMGCIDPAFIKEMDKAFNEALMKGINLIKGEVY